MEDGERALLGIIGVFAPLGWGAIAHLYKIAFSLPTADRVKDLERQVENLEKQLINARLAIRTLQSAPHNRRFIPPPRHDNDDDDDERDR